ncbi:MAG: hypothetical protein H0T92_10585 [Pyrinomonadaceae bacterium]|nr:hypothetical protein [Pyrinomonadaceae bacterium]
MKFTWPVGVHEKGIAPYPNHTAELDKPIDKQLAERWIGMLENQDIRRRAVSDPVLRLNGTLPRGDFLQRLFQYVGSLHLARRVPYSYAG